VPQYTTILYEKLGAVARVTMSRPEVRNAQDLQMTRDLDDAFAKAVEDDEVRVIILAGAGPSFSAGHDLSPNRPDVEAAYGAPGVDKVWDREMDIYLGACLRWRDLPKPTIAQVQGWCIAGGLMLATVCDLIVAADDAKFSDPVLARLGIYAVEYLSHPWEIGPRRAKELLWTGGHLDAQEAQKLGLVNRVVPRAQLEAATLELAQQIAQRSPFAASMVKFTINEVMDIMGQRSAMISAFKTHQLFHAHQRLGGEGSAPRKTGQSVSDWLKRDEKV